MRFKKNEKRLRYYNNLVILTDFHCGIANAQVEMRFQNVFRYTAGLLEDSETFPEDIPLSDWRENVAPTEPPYVLNIHNVPFGNIDYAAHALYSCYRALGRSTRPNIFIHVTDPGVGAGDDRSVLVTDEDNVFIGPNNGSLGMMVTYFHSRQIPFTLFPLNCSFVEEFEQKRMQSPSYVLPETFHGRDVLAVAGGMIAGGVKPTVVDLDLKDNNFPAVVNPFARTVGSIPMRLGEEAVFYAFQDNTFGNLKTNISLDQQTFSLLVDEQARFLVQPLNQPRFSIGKKRVMFETKNVFANVPAGRALLYLGSTFSPKWDERFVELAINMDSAAHKLGITGNYQPKGRELLVRRVG